MKNDPRRELFEDLYPAPDAGPDCDTVLGMVRAHRTARQRRNATVLGLLIVLGGAAALFLHQTSPKPPPTLAANPPPHIRNISDDELLDLLNGQPAAIATLPDGSQRLLLLVKAGR